MSLASNKILISGATSNTVGAYFQTVVISAASAGNGTVVPAGWYAMLPTANVTVTINNGSSNVTWLANNVGGTILSDGQNVRVLAASGNVNVTLMQVIEGAAVSGTFTS